MGAIVLADPGARPRTGIARYVVPALLLAGWGGLFAYSAAYLTEDLPFRPQQTAQARSDTAAAEEPPRRVVVLTAAEAGVPPRDIAEPAIAPAVANEARSDQAKPAQTKLDQAKPDQVRPDPARPDAPRPVVTAVALPGAAAAASSPRGLPTAVGADYVGTWGPTAAACGAPSRRRGYLPALITAERARAGRTICSFHDGRRAGNTWVMAAECSDRGRRWSSQVRLVVDGDRLTWTSSRGSSAYVRCGRRAG